jgi:hypothetical protein
VSTLALGGPAFAILAKVQAKDGVVVKIFDVSREIPPRARCRGGGGRRSDFVRSAELVNDAVRYR